MPHVIQHLLPTEVLRKANALAQALERDRFFRSYVVRHIWMIVPVVFLAMFFLAGVLLETGTSAMQWLGQPAVPVVRYGIVGLGIALWFLGTMLVIYWLLSRLQGLARRAQDEQRAREAEQQAVDGRAVQAVYLAEGRSFGRHACKVTLDQGVVKKSEYNYAD